jgi:putative tryptophan/tyrosine transport system substrate-binding protein
VLVNPAAFGYASRMASLTRAARALDLHLHVVELRSHEGLESAFAAMTQAGAEALFVLAEPQVLDLLHRQIVALAVQHRLPAIYGWKESVDAGGLMSYGPSLLDLPRRAAYYVARLLQGTKPAAFRWNSPRALSWSLTSRPPRPWASRCPQRFSSGRTRCSNRRAQEN